MKKALPIIVYTLVLVLVTGMIASGATLLAVSAARVDQGDTVTISRDEYATLQKYTKISNIMTLIEGRYVMEDVDEDTLIDNAAAGMVALLGDPYSFYMSPEAMESMNESDSGKYVGIGATFTTDPTEGWMVLTRIYPNSPASESDLQVGDKLYAVNGTEIQGMDTTSVTSMVRGDEGTDVTLTVLRGEEKVEVTLTRRSVDVVDVEYKLTDDGILKITLSAFNTNADKAFEEAIKFGQKNDCKGILLDLRGNGGGGDNILQPIADLLLPEGLIFYTEDHDGNRQEYRSNAYKVGLPMVVLCDENTATVAEDGSGLHLTTVRAYSPLGRNWHGEGLEPDVVVEQPEELKSNPLLRTEENDVQFIEGMKQLRSMIAGE